MATKKCKVSNEKGTDDTLFNFLGICLLAEPGAIWLHSLSLKSECKVFDVYSVTREDLFPIPVTFCNK